MLCVHIVIINWQSCEHIMEQCKLSWFNNYGINVGFYQSILKYLQLIVTRSEKIDVVNGVRYKSL